MKIQELAALLTETADESRRVRELTDEELTNELFGMIERLPSHSMLLSEAAERILHYEFSEKK